MLGNPDKGDTSLWLLVWIFAFVRDLEINSGFCLEYLLLPIPENSEDWSAINLMERKVLVHRQKATATNT